mmetsp:Transcript_17900/g.53897  ORF Transcript_17900/g.53897 Transcript_17900/m.53897 type:complete len:243 (-) Transcript_17900:499-1227(-)
MDAATSRAVSAEFLGTLVFCFLANTAKTPMGVGIAYAVSSYMAAPISSGHLNPALTMAQALSGHAQYSMSGLYLTAQILGGIVSALLEVLLLPGVHLGHHKHLSPPGCFPLHNANWLHAIIWEAGLTFVFVSVVYACTVGRKDFNPVAPLAGGLALYIAGESGGIYTGAILNPARLIGPAVVFFCGWKRFWFNLIGQLIGGLAASGFAVSSFGTGPNYGDNREELDSRTGLGERLMPEEEHI